MFSGKLLLKKMFQILSSDNFTWILPVLATFCVELFYVYFQDYSDSHYKRNL